MVNMVNQNTTLKQLKYVSYVPRLMLTTHLRIVLCDYRNFKSTHSDFEFGNPLLFQDIYMSILTEEMEMETSLRCITTKMTSDV